LKGRRETYGPWIAKMRTQNFGGGERNILCRRGRFKRIREKFRGTARTLLGEQSGKSALGVAGESPEDKADGGRFQKRQGEKNKVPLA